MMNQDKQKPTDAITSSATSTSDDQEEEDGDRSYASVDLIKKECIIMLQQLKELNDEEISIRHQNEILAREIINCGYGGELPPKSGQLESSLVATYNPPLPSSNNENKNGGELSNNSTGVGSGNGTKRQKKKSTKAISLPIAKTTCLTADSENDFSIVASAGDGAATIDKNYSAVTSPNATNVILPVSASNPAIVVTASKSSNAKTDTIKNTSFTSV